jgi:molybdopterin-guanine dinucleotide biosynthesis protein A
VSLEPQPSWRPHDLLVLAGGRAQRLGGASKPDVVVAGRTLIDHVLDAAGSARRVVVVGPPELARPGVRTVLEEPPGGGPVAGIDAGLAALGDREANADVLVLACDVPRAAAAVPLLHRALASEPAADGARLVRDGHASLVALYRREPLTAALAALREAGGVHGVSVRRMSAGLRMLDVADPDDLGADADTWDDVHRLDEALSRGAAAERGDPVTDSVGDGGPQDVVAQPVSDPGSEPVSGSDLHRWVLTLAQDLGVDPSVIDVDVLLDLSRDVAHGITRPAVPLTAFLIGYAVAADGGDKAALDRAVARTVELTRDWTP